MAFVELRGVCKSYGTGEARSEVLSDVDLDLEEGEFLAIVGFSGTGKTTLVSLLAGLVAPDRGTITLGGAPITGPGPDRGVVFQNYSLLPWLTVRGNVRLAVDRVYAHEPRAKRLAIADRYIDLVGLSRARDKRPPELSGGMKQRVAVARGLATDPRMLLLDEPLSALDALTRATLQDEIERIWERDRKTVLLITNDVDEAILLADRIVPLCPPCSGDPTPRSGGSTRRSGRPEPRPGATLGPSFPVPLARPRDRAAINHDHEFKKIRNEVTKYLLQVGGKRRLAGADALPKLPDLRPLDLSSPRMRSVR